MQNNSVGNIKPILADLRFEAYICIAIVMVIKSITNPTLSICIDRPPTFFSQFSFFIYYIIVLIVCTIKKI